MKYLRSTYYHVIFAIKFLLNYRSRSFREQKYAIESSNVFDGDYYVKLANKVGIFIKKDYAILHYILIGDELKIDPHPLFDCEYYTECNIDVRNSSMTALCHYILYGFAEFRDPHPLINSRYISTQSSDVANQLVSYIKSPKGTINPNYYFDEKYVLSNNPIYKYNDKTVIEQYIRDNDNILPCINFDPSDYKIRYSYIGQIHPLYHYLRWGIKQDLFVLGSNFHIEKAKFELHRLGGYESKIVDSIDDQEKKLIRNRLRHDLPSERLMKSLFCILNSRNFTHIIFNDDIDRKSIINNLMFHGDKTCSNNIQSMTALVITLSEVNDDYCNEDDSIYMRLFDVSQFTRVMTFKEMSLLFAILLQVSDVKSVVILGSELGNTIKKNHDVLLKSIGKSVLTLVPGGAINGL